MLWRGKSGRMADGERLMSTARAALSVSLRALFSASLCPRCYVMLSSFRAHVHSAARIGRLCPRSDRGSVVRLCRKGSNNKEKPSCGKLHPLESKPSHVTAPAWTRQAIQPRTSECVEQQAKADDARRVNLPSSSVSARDFTFSHQTAADTHRKVEGCWKRDKGDCGPRRLDTAC